MHRTIVTALLSLKSFTHDNANYSSPSSRMPFERGYYYPHKYYRFGRLFPVTMRRWQGKGRTSVLYVAPLFVFLFLFFQLPTEMTGEGEPQDTWLSHLCQRQRPHLKRVREKEHLRVTWKPVGEGSIFFTQTSCATDFSSREVRTVEGRGRRGTLVLQRHKYWHSCVFKGSGKESVYDDGSEKKRKVYLSLRVIIVRLIRVVTLKL